MSHLLKRAGTTRQRTVVDDSDGSVAAIYTDHWDDHQDVIVYPQISQLVVPDGGLWSPGCDRVIVPASSEVAEHAIREAAKRGTPPPIMGGAFGNSGLYLLNQIDVYDATQLAIDLSLTTHKWAMYTNTDTPNFSSDVGYSATNEVVGAGYTAGGRTIAAGGGSPTLTESPAGTMMYDQADMVWPAATTVTARGAKLYADALAGDNLIVAMTFVTDFTSTAGTFTIQFAATGVFTVDWTP